MSQPLLLDTNVVIWTVSASDRISARARRTISHSTAALTVSAVSVWEIVLKCQAGKLRLDAGLDEVVNQILYQLTYAHALELMRPALGNRACRATPWVVGKNEDTHGKSAVQRF